MTLLRYLWHDLGKALLTPNGQRAVMALSAAVQVWTWFTLDGWWRVTPVAGLALIAWAQVRIERSRRRLKVAEEDFAAAHLAACEARVDPPLRPYGVRVRHADGSTTPVELAYQGRNEAGAHVWAAATTLRPGDDLEGQFPPNCTLTFPVGGG